MKKRILALLLAIVMIIGIVPATAVTAMASNETAIYTYGTTDNNMWPNRMHYVGTISLAGATVDSYAWSGDTCEVVLASTTSQDASLTVSLTTVRKSNFDLSRKLTERKR